MLEPNTSSDTIVAIATPLGAGGLGVVRLSGPQAVSIASSIFKSSSQNLSAALSHSLSHGWIQSGNHKIDEAVAALFLAPKSYTGENVVEFSCHGSPAVLREVLDLCQSVGARMARPGEFTERAFLNGKMDLVQAEAVADLIHARSTTARQAASFQLNGGLSDRLQKIRQPLIDLLAHLEANLDFSEEEIPALSRVQLKSHLEDILKEIGSLLSTSLKGRWVREGLRVAIVGKPNVGKSSLFNALLVQDRAIVTDIPGTTRDTLDEQIEWDGLAVVLTDTAGLRLTTDPIEKLGTERTARTLTQADIVLMVMDESEEPTAEDERLISELRDRNTVLVLNKSDKRRDSAHHSIKNLFPNHILVETSAITKCGLDELKKAVLSFVKNPSFEVENQPCLTNLRHIHHLEAASSKIKNIGESFDNKKLDETLSLDLRDALHEINMIMGGDATEEVLNSIFSQFCIGK